MTFRALKRLGIANTTGQIRSLVVEQVPKRGGATKTQISGTKIKRSQRLICGLYQSQSFNSYYGERCDYNVR